MKKNILLILIVFNIITLTVPNYGFSQEAVDTVIFPDDFQNISDYYRFENRTLYFAQTLVVSDNYSWQRYGQLKLSSIRLMAPTDMATPNSTDYNRIVTDNAKNWIYLDDGYSTEYPTPLPFADSQGTRRIGSRINNLKAVLRRYSWGWALVPTVDYTLQFYGNERPISIDIADNHNLKVCSFNLAYYLTSNFGTGFGPDNETQAAKQHSKIIKALLAVDADIYGLIEIQQGQDAIRNICDALNSTMGNNIFSFIDDRGSIYGSYTKVGFIYRSDRVVPDGKLRNINNILPHRKKLQCFRLLANNEKFVLSLNHFKSKTGKNATGDNADNGDGQGLFNGDRVREATAVIDAIKSYTSACNDNDVLVMGDLNAYSQENPLHIFYNNGFSNILKKQNDSAYSYVYQGVSGCIDHAVANASMANQIVRAEVFHINADEPKMFEYKQNTSQDNMYRSSDHDIVVVALNLGGTNKADISTEDNVIIQTISNRSFVIKNASNQWISMFDVSGKHLLHTYITEKEQYITLPYEVNRGVYIFYIDNGKSRYVNSIKVVF